MASKAARSLRRDSADRALRNCETFVPRSDIVTRRASAGACPATGNAAFDTLAELSATDAAHKKTFRLKGIFIARKL
jgi:hypothetical protein